VVEGVLIPTLAGFGVDKAVAALAVYTYRLAQFWLPIPLGGAAYLSLRRDQRAEKLRETGRRAYEQPSSRFDWAEEYGHRPQPGDNTNSENANGDGPTISTTEAAERES
jgi:hypothetical protein